MGNQETGTIFEESVVQHLNGYTFKNLSEIYKSLIKKVFPDIKETSLIKSGTIRGFMKPDIFIEAEGKIKNISLKTGAARVIHQERVQTFIGFLRSKGISDETLKTILLMHFSDGTLNGTGPRRYSFDKMKYTLEERIKKANDELNANKYFIRDFIDHCMFIGVMENPVIADFVYHGEDEFGYAVSREKMLEYAKKMNWDYYNNLHIGPLFFRCHARYLDKPIKNEKSRMKVDVWWPNLLVHICNASKLK